MSQRYPYIGPDHPEPPDKPEIPLPKGLDRLNVLQWSRGLDSWKGYMSGTGPSSTGGAAPGSASVSVQRYRAGRHDENWEVTVSDEHGCDWYGEGATLDDAVDNLVEEMQAPSRLAARLVGAKT